MATPRKWHPVEKVCPACQKTWRATNGYQIHTQEFCSRKCRTVVHGNGRNSEKIKRDCKRCGKAIEVWQCKAKTNWFCSKSCSNSFTKRGSNNPAWKGGDALGKYWKRKARERDDFTCQFAECGVRSKSKSTHAHHKIPRSVGGEDALDNLITLCSKHHREVERLLFKSMLEHCHRENPGVIPDIVSKLYP